MEEEPPVQPALPLEYAHLKALPRRTSIWAWIAIGIFVFLWGTAIFIPSISRPTLQANRIKSGSNLLQIGQAILLYTNDFKGQYPDTFGDLLSTEDVTSAVFVSPSSSDSSATGATTQATIANLNTPGHCSYIYLGKGVTTQIQQPTMIIAYEPPAMNNNQGGNVLFGDGHVAFVNMAAMNSIQNQLIAGVWPVYFPAMLAKKP